MISVDANHLLAKRNFYWKGHERTSYDGSGSTKGEDRAFCEGEGK